MRDRHFNAAALLVLFFAGISSAQQSGTLLIDGAGVQRLEIDASEVAKMPHLSLDVQDPHGGSGVKHYNGVRLSDLLAKAGAPLGDKLRGKALATYVVAKATDGYAVVFALAEIDPAVSARQIILADGVDGKPLDHQEGPFRVIVPGEKRPARWIRMVTEFDLGNAVNPSGSSPR